MKDINATVIVDLTIPKDEMFENLRRSERKGIRKAEKEGLIVEEASSEEDWKEFYKIYKKTVIEGGANAKSLEELRRNTRNLFVCKKDNRIIAGIGIGFLNWYSSNIPILYLNASLREYLQLKPNTLLYWYCINWCREQGYDRFDLGGWQIKARGHLKGINEFKENWGKVVYYYKDYPMRIALGRKLIRNYSFFWWLNKKLRGRK